MNYELLLNYVKRYLDDVKLYKSKNTFNDEFSKLKSFLIFFKYYEDSDINKELIIDYIKFLQEKNNNSNYTVNKKVKCLNRMLSFNKLEIVDIKNLRYKKTEQKYLSESDVLKVKKYLDLNPRFIDEYDNFLDKAILNFMIDTGCRCSESSFLFTSDIDFDHNKAIIYQQKTYSNKKVYFSDRTCFYLDYLSKFNREFIFINNKTKAPIDRFYIYKLCKYISRGLNIEFHPHTLRHTCATSLIINGCPLTSVQRILGHSNINTTMNYLHIIDDVIEKDYRKYRG